MVSSTWGNRAGCGALTCSLVADGDRCLKGEWGLRDRNMEEISNEGERGKAR